MSGWGILAAGLGGGANAVGNITAGMIDQERRLQSAQVLSDINEKKALRIAERLREIRREDNIDEATGAVGTARREAAGLLGRQSNAISLEGEEAKAGSPTLRQARVDTAVAEETAKHDLAKKQAIADANDPAYIGAVTKLKLADPEVAQRIAASRAQVAASGASVGLLQAQTEGVKLSNEDKKALDKLYGEAGTILSDTTIDDAERAKRYTKVSQQIVLMKSKNGQVAARDPDLDTQTVTEEKVDPKTGDVTKIQRKEVRRPGSGGGSPANDSVIAEARAAIAAGADPAKVEQRLREMGKTLGANAAAAAPSERTRKDPISGQELNEREWDRKYGKGDFRKLYKPGEDALTEF